MPEVDHLWRRVERALLNRIEKRERELLELHEDYMELERRYQALWGTIRRQAERDTVERVNRMAKAANG